MSTQSPTQQKEGYKDLTQEEAQDLLTAIEVMLEAEGDVLKRFHNIFPAGVNLQKKHESNATLGKWLDERVNERYRTDFRVVASIELMKASLNKKEIEKIRCIAEGREIPNEE